MKSLIIKCANKYVFYSLFKIRGLKQRTIT